MRVAIGILIGIVLTRIPKLIGPIFNDLPGDPEGHTPKSRRWDHGVLVLDWPPVPVVDETAFEKVATL